MFACLSLFVSHATLALDANVIVEVDIPAQRLSSALVEFGRQTGVQVMTAAADVGDLQSSAVQGRLPFGAALSRLLEGTHLQYQDAGPNSVVVGKPATLSQTDQQQQKEGKNASSDTFRLAQTSEANGAQAGAIGPPNSAASLSGAAPVQLQEVIVTAQKRAERLQDVPVSVTVLNPNTLAENGQNRLVDYFSSVPGLNLSANSFGGGEQYLTLRGLSAGFAQNPTITTVIDDIPVVSSIQRNFGNLSGLDLDPSDLARIEVLKGPQGTLYGADSLGGLIKFVTADPSPHALTGRAEVGGVDIPSGGLGYAVRGAANIPATDQFAVRASAFYRRDPGYIDDLTTARTDFNSAESHGGRIAALWRPSEDFSLKLSGLIQQTHGDAGQINSNSLLQFPQGDLKHTGLPGTSRYDTQVQLYSAALNAKVAGVDVVSLTGYAINTLHNWVDFTTNFNQFSDKYFRGSLGSPWENYFKTEKISQEVRLSSSIGSWLEWRIGGFYTNEHTPGSFQSIDAADLTTGAVTGAWYNTLLNSIRFSEHAVFGDLTAHFTDRFDVQLGGRESWNSVAWQLLDVGPAVGLFDGADSPNTLPRQATSGDAFTYLVSPRLKISPDLMIYARVASGYRIGGANSATPLEAAAGTPVKYDPDKTTNYELGVKGNLLDHGLSFDAAAYYINWRHFQISLFEFVTINGVTNGVGYTSNAGNAKSEGVEFSLQAHPAAGLTITAQGSFDDAVLTQNLPAASTAYGLAGDRLPYSMRFSGGLTANQDIHLADEWVGFVGGAVNYVGARPYEFTSSATQPRIEFPGYTQFNLRVGARHDTWLVNLYINNVADKRAIVGIGNSTALDVTGGYYATVIQRRTVGLSVAKIY